MASTKYWLFVIGVVVGAYTGAIARYSFAVSALVSMVERATGEYFVFLQVGILAGILARFAV